MIQKALTATQRRSGLPRCYLAGKIGPHGWRDQIACPRIGEDDAFDRDFVEVCKDFVYTGPFFVSCDHRCHGPGTHGAGEGCAGDGVTQRERRVHYYQCLRIQGSDILFAFINEADCYGTLAEIGFAAKAGKFVAIAYGPKAPRSDLWFVERFAAVTFRGFGVSDAFKQTIEFWQRELKALPSEPLRLVAKGSSERAVNALKRLTHTREKPQL